MKINTAKVILLFLILILLYVLVYYGFYFQQYLLVSAQFIYPLLIVGLFLLMVYFTIKIVPGFKMHELLEAFIVIAFVVLSWKMLYMISSVNRETEILSYYKENENKLMELVSHYQTFGSDEKLDSLVSAADLNNFYFRRGVYRCKLYCCVGYGYKLAYTETPDSLTRKICFEASPIRKYIKINSHWSYYSYFD